MHQIGNIAVDDACATVSDTVLPLTAFELKVLHRLAAANGAIVTVDELHTTLYGHAAIAAESNVLQVFIGRLRKKFVAAGAHAVIHTVRGQGYQLVAVDVPSTEAATA